MRIRSAYSFRYAYGKLDQVFDRVFELNWPAMPISDRLSTFAFVDWDSLCIKHNKKPVFGVEIGVTAQLGVKKPAISHFTFFAIDKLRSINELVYHATSQVGYSLLTYEEAIFAKDCVVIADNRVILSEIYPHDNFYIALSPATPIGLYREAKRKGFQFIASSDNVFPREKDKLPYHVILNMNAEQASYPQYILTDEEWRAALPYCVTDEDAHQAIWNRNHALDICNAKLLKADLFKIKDDFSLKQMCVEGAWKLGVDLHDPIYAERLKLELDLIHEKNFQDYFFIVADLVTYAKKHMIVGPARGSAAGSLVCYLTGITTIDPLKFNLLFERFIDVTRADLPDIDLDFSDAKRHLVFEYLRSRYGENHSARLGSVMSYRPKSILNTAGISLGIPKWLTEQVADTLIERSSADSRAQQTFEETFYATDIGKKLVNEYPEIAAVFDAEDHPTNAGQHAAGMAIMNGEVLDYVAVDGRTGVIMADKYMAEKLNFLKIDVLGISQLSIFERCLELIGKEPRNGFLEALPLDDQSAFDVMNKKQFSGIFQAMGKSLQILFNMIHTDRLDDLVAITALSRPGPVASGGAVRWTRRRSGKEQAQYRHPLLEPYLKPTYGEVVYQEQVMSICRDIGQMGFREVTRIRKAMSKSLGVEEMNKLGEPFKEGAIRSGIPPETVDIIWGELIEFGAWGFNLSHAVSYGMITYWCLAEGTEIELAYEIQGKRFAKIEDLYHNYMINSADWQINYRPNLISFNEELNIGVSQRPIRIIKTGIKDCWKFTFSEENLFGEISDSVTCTLDHQFLINGKWQKAGESKIGDEWLCMFEIDQNRTYTHKIRKIMENFRFNMKNKPCEDCNKKKDRMEVHHNDFNEGRSDPYDLSWICRKCHFRRHHETRKQRTYIKKLTQIEHIGEKMCYDIVMPIHHNFKLANGLIAHNCCWLKAHYPVEFAAATLDNEYDAIKQLRLLRELKMEGTDYVPIDRDYSVDRWNIKEVDGKKVLVGPLTNIHGVGPVLVRKIMDSRLPGGAPLTPALKAKLDLAVTKIDSLTPIFDAIKPMLEPNNIVTPHTPIFELETGMQGEYMILGLVKRIQPRDLNDLHSVAKRGRKLQGQSWCLNLFVHDDTDEILCTVNRWDYETVGKQIEAEGGQGDVLYAIKGTIPPTFRMIQITGIRLLGRMSDSKIKEVKVDLFGEYKRAVA